MRVILNNAALQLGKLFWYAIMAAMMNTMDYTGSRFSQFSTGISSVARCRTQRYLNLCACRINPVESCWKNQEKSRSSSGVCLKKEICRGGWNFFGGFFVFLAPVCGRITGRVDRTWTVRPRCGDRTAQVWAVRSTHPRCGPYGPSVGRTALVRTEIIETNLT